MKIPCREIAQFIEKKLIEEVASLKQKRIQPKLVTFLLDASPEQQSFVSIKKRVGERLGIDFELVNPADIPTHDELLSLIHSYADQKETSGIIIQLPLPKHIDKQELYDVIPTEKEIEGHKENSDFQFPLSLAVLTGIKYIYSLTDSHSEHVLGSSKEMPNRVPHNNSVIQKSIVDFEHDAEFFRSVLKNKNIVIAGRGPTGGEPISNAFKSLHIPHDITNSQTPNVDDIYRQADIIITATGNHIIHSDNIKEGAILLNVGLRKENGGLRGDYNEDEIKEKASFYTETPGGLGPLDVLYLYKNVIDAAKMV